MTLIEGIGDEVTHFFIGLFVIIIVTIAWWTTSISEQRELRTVLLLHRRRHRTLLELAHRTLSNHTETITITEGSTRVIPETNSESNSDEVPSVEMTDSNKPSEAGTSSEAAATEEQTEQNNIIEAMDSKTCELRQRRIAFFDNLSSSASDNNDQPQNRTDTNEPPRVEEVLMEHNYADKEHVTTVPAEQNASHQDENSIRIKLKYINDDLRLVDGNLEEKLGDFKQRHFEVDLSANKLVRLIFNGHVLQPDTNTLRSCGLFDNCVVHCLIHPKRNQTGENQRSSSSEEDRTHRTENSTQNLNNNEVREWDLGNILFVLVSLILLVAWYFRYVYAHLYTITATVGLIIITGIFAVILIGMNFPDTEQPAAQYTIHARVQTQRQQ